MIRRASALLVAQAVALGLLLAFIVIPASARFLGSQGPERLPYVYLVVAGLGAAVSASLARLQHRFRLVGLAVATTLLIAVLLFGGWLLLGPADRSWVSFALLVLFSLQLQLGFVFVGAQAGRVLDVQQIKRTFPRIVAGFVGGFMVGGFLGRPLIALLGRPEHLVLLSALVAGVMAGLMLLTAPAIASRESERTNIPSDDKDAETPRLTLRELLVVPLVASVFVYQLLSAMGTQLVEYLVYDRAAVRYSDTESLARFMSDYTVIVNVIDLAVLVLLAGFLMSRFGLRFGVAANPVIVSGLVTVAVAISWFGDAAGTSFFIVVCAARISDLTLADAGTRTSVNAAYQALPEHQRLAAQVGVEGAGGPMALGLTGGLLLVVNAAGAGFGVIVLITLAVCVLWCAASVLVYRRYRRAVVAAARRRTVEDAVIDLTDAPTRRVVLDLARSEDPDDVRFALDLLATVDGADFDDELSRLSREAPESVQRSVVDLLAERFPSLGREIALAGASSLDDVHRRTAVRALRYVDSEDSKECLEQCLHHDDRETRVIAWGSLLAHENGDRVGPFTSLVHDLASSDHVDERIRYADILSEFPRAVDPVTIVRLLDDPAADVRSAVAEVIARMSEADRDRIARKIFDSEAPSTLRARRTFLRGCRHEISSECAELLVRMLSSASAVAAGELVSALLVSEWHPDQRQRDILTEQMERDVGCCLQMQRWIRSLGASAESGEGDDPDLLRSALAAELDEAQGRVVALVGLLYDRQLAHNVGRVLRGLVPGDRAMALESLDVTLDPSHRSSVLGALMAAERAPADPGSRSRAISEIAIDPGVAAHPDWLRAAAISVLEIRELDIVDLREPVGPVTTELLLYVGGHDQF